MDDQVKAWLAIAIIVSAVWVTIVMLIDVKIKNDIVKAAMRTDDNLNLIRAFSETMRGQGATGPNGTGQGGNSGLPGMHATVSGDDLSNLHAGLEKEGANSQVPSWNWRTFASGIADS